MTDKNDLKPGDFARHPKHPELIGTVSYDYSGVLWVNYVGSNGYRLADRDLTDWERVEVVQPGHVQIKVDDLELHGWANTSPSDRWNDEEILSHRAAKARAAQRADSKPPANVQIRVDDEKPTSTTVTLPCPDCGEAITRTAEVWTGIPRNRTLAWATTEWHTCPPPQPDEPTEFGAVVEVKGVRYVRADDDSLPWMGAFPTHTWSDWNEITDRGPVTVLSEGVPS